jgi:hypothetical protein
MMVQSAGYQLRNPLSASVLSTYITSTDVYDAIDHSRNGSTTGNMSVNHGQVILILLILFVDTYLTE